MIKWVSKPCGQRSLVQTVHSKRQADQCTVTRFRRRPDGQLRQTAALVLLVITSGSVVCCYRLRRLRRPHLTAESCYAWSFEIGADCCLTDVSRHIHVQFMTHHL